MIEFKNVAFAYDNAVVFSELNLSIPDAGITAICAPSGVGKTTLLRLIAGLEKPQVGSITGVPARISCVFQEDRLLPWFSALENIQCVCKEAKREEILAFLSKLGITEELALKLPSELSGGQNQRVCLARALMFGGSALLLDEPFTGLDDKNRQIALKIIKEYAKDHPVILVSHIKDDLEVADTILEISA